MAAMIFRFPPPQFGQVHGLVGIFNAAATIHGSGDYMTAVAAVALQRAHRGGGSHRAGSGEI